MRTVIAFILSVLIAVPSFAAEPVHLDRDGEKWADKTLKKMSVEQKVGQLFVVWARSRFLNANSPDYLQYRDELKTYHVGGFGLTVQVNAGYLVKSGPLEAADLVNRLQADAEFPLFIAADFERGLSMRLRDVTAFPHAMAFGAAGNKEWANAFGRITAEEARAIGVQWNWFPDADVNSNPANPIINVRSFGEDPQQVSAMVTEYIKGARAAGMMTTAKHFPGHGDTATDTHIGLAQVTGNMDRLNSVELPPFKAAIEAGVDSVMIGHVTVPALESDPNRPASISAAMTDKLLKQQMGFKGLTVTDALDMGGLTRVFGSNDIAVVSAKAAVESFKAGSDVLLIPGDLPAAYNAVLDAVKRGEITQQRLDQSVLKILRAKASVGLHKNRFVDLKAIDSIIARPESLQIAQQVADAAVTMVRNNGKVLPLPKTGTSADGLPYQAVATMGRVLFVVFTPDTRLEADSLYPTQVRMRQRDSRVLFVDDTSAAGMAKEVLDAVQAAEKVVAIVDVYPTAGGARQATGGQLDLPHSTGDLLTAMIQRGGDKTIVVGSGSPYVISMVPNAPSYMCAFSDTQVSQMSVIKALFGEIPIRGRMPVSIPGVADRGAGIDVAAAQ